MFEWEGERQNGKIQFGDYYLIYLFTSKNAKIDFTLQAPMLERTKVLLYIIGYVKSTLAKT